MGGSVQGMMLPERVQPGDPVEAAEYNALLDAVELLAREVQARTLRPGADIGVREGGSGGVVAFLKSAGGGGVGRIGRLMPYGLRKVAGGGWRLPVSPGVLVDGHIGNESGAGALRVVVPTINDEPILNMDPAGGGDWVPPMLTLPGVSSYIYLHFATDQDGKRKEDLGPEGVVVEAYAAEQASVHHRPADGAGAGGVEGDYYVLLGRTVSNGKPGASEAPILLLSGRTGDYYWGHYLPGIVNLGGDAAVYKALGGGRYELRGPKGLYAIKVTEEADTFDIEFEAENVGVGTGYWAQVYKEPVGVPAAADKAQFHIITQGPAADQKQIRMAVDGDLLRIWGNEFNKTLDIQTAGGSETLIAVEDGLVTGMMDGPIYARSLKVCVSGSVETWEVLSLTAP